MHTVAHVTCWFQQSVISVTHTEIILRTILTDWTSIGSPTELQSMKDPH